MPGIIFRGADNYPVERYIGRPITNFIRLLLYTRRIIIWFGEKPGTEKDKASNCETATPPAQEDK